MKFLDDLVYASNELGSEVYPPFSGNSKGLRSISCRRGSQTCDLVFEDDPSFEYSQLLVEGQSNWLEVAKKAQTDKVQHGYGPMYQEYLGSFSGPDAEPFVFVEMGYANGKSSKLWREFFPNADVHEMELSCDMVPYANLNRENWEHRLLKNAGEVGVHLHCGDARVKDFVDQSLDNFSQPYVFIDDGGHGPADMIEPFKNVFPKLQKGGYYFVEDLAQARHMQDHFPDKILKPILRDLIAPAGAARQSEFSDEIDHVKCRFQICVFVKKGGEAHQNAQSKI